MRIPKRFRGIMGGLAFMAAAPVVLGMMSPQQLVSAKVASPLPTSMMTVVVTPGPSPHYMLVTPAPTLETVAFASGSPTPTAAFTAPDFTPPAANSARAYALSVLPSYGWGADADQQFACLDALWNRESGWDAFDYNPWSGAYGIPQAVPGSKMAAYGADWKTNPDVQITWGLHYIKARYGSPCGAWAQSQEYGWY